MTDPSTELRRAPLDRQRILAEFGAMALNSDDLDEILADACRLVGEALDTDLARVMEFQGDGETLLVRAGVGWKPGVVGHAAVRADPESSDGFALKVGEPISSDDVEREGRFAYPPFLIDDGVKALVNVMIVGAEGKPPFGTLEVDSRSLRRFTGEDTAFLQTYANLIAATVARFRLVDALRDTVREKERLLAELQHRIKNNLQVITAFVCVQCRRTASPEAKAELEAIGNRIETLRLVHDKLYAAGEVDRVDLAPYLTELSGALLTFHGEAAANIRLRIELDRVHVAPETAVPLGLVVNEFVTNSMKYAFDGQRGVVGLELVANGNGPPRLTLWDDGKGFHDKPNGGTGMRLVDGLVGQLGARARWEGGDGARLTVEFPRSAILD